MIRRPPRSTRTDTLFPYTTLFRSRNRLMAALHHHGSQAKGIAMKTLLQIKTSVFSDRGTSTRPANEFVAGWQKSHPAGRAVLRDLASGPLPHLSANTVRALFPPDHNPTTEHQATSAAREEQTEEQ